MEEGNQPGDMAISGGHGNAQEEYAMRRRSGRGRRKEKGWREKEGVGGEGGKGSCR